MQNILNIVSLYDGVQDNIDLFVPFSAAFAASNKTWASQYNKPAVNLVALAINDSIRQVSPFANYLTNRGVLVSGLTSIVANLSLSSSLLLPQGQWIAEVEISHAGEFATYFLEMDVAKDIGFSTILYSLSTETGQINWTYEKDAGSFTTVPSSGITSNYAGRRVRYTSPSAQYFSRAEIFYFRVRQKGVSPDDFVTYSSYVTYQGIVNT